MIEALEEPESRKLVDIGFILNSFITRAGESVAGRSDVLGAADPDYITDGGAITRSGAVSLLDAITGQLEDQLEQLAQTEASTTKSKITYE